jgi:hypothetical protein
MALDLAAFGHWTLRDKAAQRRLALRQTSLKGTDMAMKLAIIAVLCVLGTGATFAQNCPYDPRCLNNPYGAGNPYKADGLNNPYSTYGSPYSNKSHTNPYATDAPKLYDSNGNYRGRLSSNPYDADSTSNPYGRYGNPYSPDSINNPYGAGNPYGQPLQVVPSR